LVTNSLPKDSFAEKEMVTKSYPKDRKGVITQLKDSQNYKESFSIAGLCYYTAM